MKKNKYKRYMTDNRMLKKNWYILDSFRILYVEKYHNFVEFSKAQQNRKKNGFVGLFLLVFAEILNKRFNIIRCRSPTSNLDF